MEKNKIATGVGFAGGGVFFILNHVTQGVVPGGFIGGAGGFGLGYGVARIVLAMIPENNKQKHSESLATDVSFAEENHELKTEFSERTLCPDGRCIGVVAEDGYCKTCGKNYADQSIIRESFKKQTSQAESFVSSTFPNTEIEKWENMKKKTVKGLLIFAGFIILAIALNVGTNRDGQENISGSSRTTKNINLAESKENIFSVSIPPNWIAIDSAELLTFKNEYEKQSSQLFQEYYGHSENYNSGVTYIKGVSDQNNEVKFVMIAMKIPPQTEDYLNQMYSRAKNVTEWGLSEGEIVKVHSNVLITLNGLPSLKTDLQMNNGSRLVSYSIYKEDQPEQAVQINMLFKQGSFNRHESDAKMIFDSFGINKTKERTE